MITVKEALEIALNHTNQISIIEIPITEAVGCILAENIYSDIDLPPFDKSSMDGYALRAKDCTSVPVVLDVIDTIPAGVLSNKNIGVKQAAKIMTGAPVPAGADCVQMVEKTELLENGQVRILEPVPKGKNIAGKSEIIKTDQQVFESGIYISPAVVGVLAAVGKTTIFTYKKPEVSIVVSGDEIVNIDQVPGAGQIRNSNGYALLHQVVQAGGIPRIIGIARDEIDDLKAKIEMGLKSDILLISGGVSMGDFDLVENVLAEYDVQIFYDKVNIKPGKPTVFGKKDNTLIFGLPGNPVSAGTIFELIVRPVIRKILGFKSYGHIYTDAILKEDYSSQSKRENYQPAQTYLLNNLLYTKPVKSKGSADILAFSRSNSYIKTTESNNCFNAGDKITVVLRDEFWINY